MGTLAWLARACALVLLLSLGLTACERSQAGHTGPLDRAADDAWVGPELADFRMPSSDGREVGLADLRGAPFVLDFIFTTCTGPCPQMSANMSALQADLADTPVRLVSVSVDPETDSLAVLAAYAAGHGADPERWMFLRGEESDVVRLATSVSLTAQRNPDAALGMQVAHSARLLVVDAEGRVRGYYPGTTPEGRAQAAARARWLAKR